MKTRKFLWVLLPVAAVLLMTACGGDDADDVTPVPSPVTPGTDSHVVNSLPYTVTVKTADVTRTSVDNDDITLRFESDDMLYVQNADGTVYGSLTLKAGTGETSATFAGTINYTGSTPAASTSLTATLVGSSNQLNMVENGKVKTDANITYPGTVCESMSDAVQKYSWISGTGTYGEATFALAQKTAFLKFNVTLEDGTTGGDIVPVVIKSGGSTIGTGNVTSTGSQFNALASFILPLKHGSAIAGDTEMCVANVGDDDESITFGTGSTVTLVGGKVYPVTRTKDFVRLWAGGPVWATKNIGATSVTDKGGYYCWGGLVDVTNVTLGWNSNCPYWKSGSGTGHRTDFTNIDLKFSRYVPTASTEYWGGDGNPDNLTTLLPEDDVATQTLGSPWRMPTIDEFDKSTGLLAKTTKLGTTVNGALGVIYTGISDYNKKAIFLPTAGDRVSTGNGTGYGAPETIGIYWSSSLKTDQPYCAQDILSYQNTSASSTTFQFRNYGRNVRAVHN